MLTFEKRPYYAKIKFSPRQYLKKVGAIAEYPALPADFDSTATVVRDPQSASQVICMH